MRIDFHNIQVLKKEQQQIENVYLKLGIKGVLGYLFAFLSRFIEPSRIALAEIIPSRELISGLGDIAPNSEYTGYRNTKFYDMPSCLLPDGGSFAERNIHIENQLDFSSDILQTVYAGYYQHHSRVTIPIADYSDYLIHFFIYCDNYGVFTEEFAENIKLLLSPLGESIFNKRTEEKAYNDITNRSHSEFEVLRRCPDMTGVLQRIEKSALFNITVLLTGETGTGKTSVAKMVHELSPRKSKPFISINCAALPESLAESILFGHERGAFTGAVNSSKGVFEQAQGGTIFLDEIGEMTMPIQAKLLKAIDEKIIQRVGSPAERKIDVRVISATNQDLFDKVRRKLFREDLYYRLSVCEIRIPPLRDRKRDIPLLLRMLLQRSCTEMGISPVPTIPHSEYGKLSGYSWPGNIRELKSLIESGLIEYSLKEGEFFLLGEYLQKSCKRYRGANNAAVRDESAGVTSEIREFQKRSTGLDTIMPLDALIQSQIEHALDVCNGKINGTNGAAARLDIPRSTLYSYLKKYNLKGK